jgi:ketosteroid isomerase-like protein
LKKPRRHGKENEMHHCPACWIAAALLVFSSAAAAADLALLAPVEAEIKALNRQDAERAGACYTDDAVVIVRPDLPFFGAERKINGRAEVTQWFKDILAVNFRMEARFLSAEGNTIKAEVTTWTSVTEKLGIAPMDGMATYTVEGGKIVKMVYVMAPESVHKFTSARNRVLAIAAVILVAVVALIWWGLRRVCRRRGGFQRSGG